MAAETFRRCLALSLCTLNTHVWLYRIPALVESPGDSRENTRVAIDLYAVDRGLTEMADSELRRHAQAMLRLAEFQPSVVGRSTFVARRDIAGAELERRGIAAEEIRAELRAAECDRRHQ